MVVPLWLTVTLAVWAYLGTGWAIIITLAVALLTGSWIVQLGLHTRGDDRGFRAGRNQIEWRWISGATALDADAARAQVNSHLGHRAFLLTRPYVGSAVLLTLDDAADPHPAWIVATRRPEALAEFVNRHIGARPIGDGNDTIATSAGPQASRVE